MKKLKGVISVFTLSLCLLSLAQAEEQRYISIRNTDMVWVRIPMIPASDSGDFDRASRAGYFLL